MHDGPSRHQLEARCRPTLEASPPSAAISICCIRICISICCICICISICCMQPESHLLMHASTKSTWAPYSSWPILHLHPQIQQFNKYFQSTATCALEAPTPSASSKSTWRTTPDIWICRQNGNWPQYINSVRIVYFEHKCWAEVDSNVIFSCLKMGEKMTKVLIFSQFSYFLVWGQKLALPQSGWESGKNSDFFHTFFVWFWFFNVELKLTQIQFPPAPASKWEGSHVKPGWHFIKMRFGKWEILLLVLFGRWICTTLNTRNQF